MPVLLRTAVWLLLSTAVAGALVAESAGQTTYRESFEAGEVSWQDGGGDTKYRYNLHQRKQGEGREGSAAELVSVAADSGTYVYLMHPISPARIIAELRPTLWVQADRPGIQLLARLVLPRTRDPRTGMAVTTLIRGSSYNRVGAWQQLVIEDIPRQLERTIPALRAEYGPQVDAREAYIDRVLLNVYSGPGVTNVRIDDLEINGIIVAEAMQATAQPAYGASLGGWGDDPTADRPKVEFTGATLLVSGKPYLPRMLEYRGEPLPEIQARGFNTILMEQTPGASLLAEARRLGLWIVCPPPEELRAESAAQGPELPPEISTRFDAVLAWHLGRGLGRDQLDTTRQLAARVRQADQRLNRPLVCEPDAELRTYSRHADILITRRLPIGTSLELRDWADWVRKRPALARPGTPCWTVIQTQYDPALAAQARIVSGQSLVQPTTGIPFDQMQLLVHEAVANGARGLCFQSRTPLRNDDPRERQRALALELVNLQLNLLEPWAAGGSRIASIESNVPQVHAAMLQAGHARLVLPIWNGAQSQLVPGQSAGRQITLVVPGVPEAHKAYLCTPAGIRPLTSTRVTLGKRVEIDEFGLVSTIVFTQDQDPLVLRSLTMRLKGIEQQAAQVARELAALRLIETRRVFERLDAPALNEPGLAGWWQGAETYLRQCDARLAVGDWHDAYLQAERALRPIRLAERTQWRSAAGRLPSGTSSPLTASFATLPEHWRFMRQAASVNFTPDQLAGGQFEDLSSMLAAGWRRYEHPQPQVAVAAGLQPQEPHGGQFSLRMKTEATGDPALRPPLLESPPVWITSPAVRVPPGSLVRIRGWVRIPAPIQESADGVLIFDSLGGESLAVRLRQTSGWQEFTMYRVAADSTDVSLVFALAGIGELWLDDVSIEPVLERLPGGREELPSLAPRGEARPALPEDLPLPSPSNFSTPGPNLPGPTLQGPGFSGVPPTLQRR